MPMKHLLLMHDSVNEHRVRPWVLVLVLVVVPVPVPALVLLVLALAAAEQS